MESLKRRIYEIVDRLDIHQLRVVLSFLKKLFS